MKKRQFTWLDGLICGIVVAAIAAVAFLFIGKNLNKEPVVVNIPNLKTYELTMRFTRTTTKKYDNYKVGDMLYFQNRTQGMGEITYLEEIDHVQEDYDATNGVYKKVVDPEKKTVVMKIEVEGTLNKDKFLVKGAQMNIGMIFYPQSDTTRSTMTLWDIKEVD